MEGLAAVLGRVEESGSGSKTFLEARREYRESLVEGLAAAPVKHRQFKIDRKNSVQHSTRP